MKPFKLREEKTFIKILKEPPNRKKKVNWSRRVYLLIFTIILFLVGRRVYNGNMIIFANGQIDLPKQTINFPNDIKILQLLIEEGQEICQGDTLFKYIITTDEIDQATFSANNTSTSWILKEKLSVLKKIELNTILINNKIGHLDLLNESIRLKESLLVGGIHDEYNHYSALLENKESLKAEIALLKEEIEVYKKYLYRLNLNQRSYDEINLSKLALYNEVRYFTAPMDGVISEIFYAPNEICYKKEEVMTIHQTWGATINTYFDPNEIAYLEAGDQVDISFPDGSDRKGMIRKIYVSTYALPSEFQKKYEPTERNIVAEVIPMSKAEGAVWNHYYKMEVKVKKNRYALFF